MNLNILRKKEQRPRTHTAAAVLERHFIEVKTFFKTMPCTGSDIFQDPTKVEAEQVIIAQLLARFLKAPNKRRRGIALSLGAKIRLEEKLH